MQDRLRAVVRRSLIGVAFLAAALVVATPALASLRLVSVNSGGPPGNGFSRSSAFSADGGYIAFVSGASNLGANPDVDTNGFDDAYRYDLKNDAYDRANLVDGTHDQADSSALACAGCVAISGDGRYVAFTSFASNLTGLPTNGTSQVYVRDMLSDRTIMVSQAAGGGGGNGESGSVSEQNYPIAISDDGTYVVFTSNASDLIPGVGGSPLVYVRDVVAGVTSLASVSTLDGVVPANGSSFAGAISGDGRFVTYESTATNLLFGVSGRQVYVTDRDPDENGTFEPTRMATSLVSGYRAETGAIVAGDGTSRLPAISRDGTTIAYVSNATNLDPGTVDGNDLFDAFVFRRGAAAGKAVDVDSQGIMGDVRRSRPSLSADGLLVAYLRGRDTINDVFVRNLETGVTTLASKDDQGNPASDSSGDPSLTATGTNIAFFSGGLSFGVDSSFEQVWWRDVAGLGGGGGGDALADLGVAQSVDRDPVAVGKPVRFTITVTNKGPNTAEDVHLENAFSGSVSFTTGTATVSQGPGCSADLVDCPLDAIPAGDSATVAVSITPTELAFEGPSNLRNDAEVFSDTTTDPNSDNNFSSEVVAVVRPGLATGVSITAKPGSSEAGAREVAVADIPLDAIPNEPGSTASAPLAGVPLAGVPLAGVPLAGVPLAGVGFSIASLQAAFGGVSLAQLPLLMPGGWPQRLAANGLPDLPLQSTTIAEALGQAPNLLTNPTPITLGDVGIASSPLAGVPLAGVALGPLLLSDIPLLGRIGADGLDDWCAQLNLVGGSCPNGTSLQGKTVMDETLAGAPLAGVPLAGVPLAGVPLAGVPLAGVPLAGVVLNSVPLAGVPLAGVVVGTPLAGVPISAIPVATVGHVVDCATYACAGKNLGNASADGALKPEATLGDLLGALGGITLGDIASKLPLNITLADIFAALIGSPGQAYERLPFTQMPTQDFATNPATVIYHVGWTIAGGPFSADVDVSVQMPVGFRYRKGTAELIHIGDGTSTAPAPDPTVAGQLLTWKGLPDIVQGDGYRLDFRVSPKLILGPSGDAHATVTPAGGDPVSADGAAIDVGDTYEPVNNDPPSAPVLKKDTVYLSYFPSSRDRDTYRFPAPPSGSRVTFKLLPPDGIDLDLTLSRPNRQTVRSVPSASVPLDALPIVDNGLPVTHARDQATPEPLQDVPTPPGAIAAVSDNRGDDEETATVITSPGDAGTDLRIDVTPYQSSTLDSVASDLPYTLLVTVKPPPVLPPCAARTYPHAGEGTTGTLPAVSSLASNVNTVFVVNAKRLGDTYGAAGASSVLAGLQTLAGRADLGVVGAVLPVDGDAAVAAAAGAVDANPCAPDLQNALASSISDVIESVRAARPSLKYVVLVGGDDQIPFFRIDDYVTIENETEYAQTFFDANNQYFGSLFSGKLVTDNPYGSPSPTAFLDRYLYVPSLAVGRLVESPADILHQLDVFQTFNGALDPKTALVTGYDFLADGAEEVASTEVQQHGAANVSTVIAHTGDAHQWTLAELQNVLANPADILSVNAHYDHFRALPADQNAALSNPAELLNASFLTGKDLARKFSFTVGCHSGYSVSDVVIGGPADVRALDWPQAYNAGGAGYAANTGFGYGDTVAVAYSERLMSLLAKRMDGTLTVGEALVAAKHDYKAKMALGSPYDEKVLSEATFYGLPMFKVGTTAPPSAPAPLPTAPDPTTGITSASVDVNTSPQEKSSPFGRYWTSNDGTDNVFFRPVQPQASLDVTQPTLVAHGAAITALESTDVPGFVNAAFSMPTADLTGRSPEPVFGNVIFPTKLQSITTTNGPIGRRQRLVLVAGRFASDPTQPAGTGKQRLFTNFGARIYYQPASVTDFTPAQFGLINGVQLGGSATFSVHVSDPGGGAVKDVLVGYHNGPAWTFVHLTQSPADATLWTGGGPNATPGAEFFVQAVDAAGNVSNAIFKGRYYSAAIPPPLPAGITVDLAGTPGNSGWFRSNVTATVSGLDSGDGIDLDGGDFNLSSPVSIENDGLHVLGLRHGGKVFSKAVAIDATAPTISIASPTAGQIVTLGDGTKATFSCADNASGVASCTANLANGSTIGGPVGTRTLTVTAADVAGNTATKSVTFEVRWVFKGFFSPVDNPPTLNVIKAGQAVPVKFSLGGNFGLDIFASGYPRTILQTCASGATTDLLEQTVTAGNSSLSYDSGNQQYTYVWKTPSSWVPGSCHQLQLKLVDGTLHVANFKAK